MKNKKFTKTELFLELAEPNKLGKNRWVWSREFIGKHQSLQLGNGGNRQQKKFYSRQKIYNRI